MDENTAQPQVIYTAPTPWYKRKLLWILGLFLILIPASFYLYKIYFLKNPAQTPVQQPTQVQSEPSIKESELPVAVNILQNPMVYEWRGSVNGTLTAKDDKSITLTDDQGHSIIIPITPSSEKITGTVFYKRETKNNKPQYGPISYMDIPLGTKLRGDFFVGGKEKNRIIGSSFAVVDIVK